MVMSDRSLLKKRNVDNNPLGSKRENDKLSKKLFYLQLKKEQRIFNYKTNGVKK